MNTLTALLDGVTVTKMFIMRYGKLVVTQDLHIAGIQYNSTQVKTSDLFVAIRGTKSDGHKYIGEAIEKGAIAVVMEDDAAVPDSIFAHTGAAKIVVPNSRRALAAIAANYYGYPAKKLSLIGVTGTNGKTTTTYLVKEMLEKGDPSLQAKVGLIGTISYSVGGAAVPATHTTPESLELQKLFDQMVRNGCTHVVMEVSSHALHQERVRGMEFAAAVFTNLTQDHLDYHGTMEEYFKAKLLLFQQLAPGGAAIVNSDDPYGARLAETHRGQVLTYGLKKNARVRAENISLTIARTRMVINENGNQIEITSPLVGLFNVYNILAAFSAGSSLGISSGILKRGIEQLNAVPGRFHRISSPAGWTAVVDYAHTPDALEKCLRSVRDVMGAGTGRKVITVFGAGGDRDKTKRPLMGMTAEGLSDIIILTSDNPRTEDPTAIIADIQKGIGRTSGLLIEPDRRKAIVEALSLAGPQDVVLIAGKGHENYQVIGTTKHHFDDVEVVQDYITEHS
jgi:UDP-N-acetylmuramoyl-L-alanyl-D-glutamate--2,6-diaminopimelate ligase